MRLFLLGIALGLIALAAACGDTTSDRDANTAVDTAVTVASPSIDTSSDRFIIEPEEQSFAELQRRREIVYSWQPQHKDRLDYALDGVTSITFFDELGLGDLDITLPRQGEGGSPIGHSVRLKLVGDKPALATRFVVDTLPGRRTGGEGILGLAAVHCSDSLGHNIELPRIHSSTGRFDVLYKMGTLMAQLACCDLPPTIGLGHYGGIGDTLALLYLFEKRKLTYRVMLLGPSSGRLYPGYNYGMFRTERGEFHRDLDGYPYYCRVEDPDFVNLYVGSRWRGRKAVQEPILRVRMF